MTGTDRKKEIGDVMIKIACLLDKKNGVIADSFAKARHAVIMDADTGSILKEFGRGNAAKGISDAEFARKIAQEDPEAVITGEIEKEPFEILAEEFWITRYNGVGLKVSEAIRLMNEYRLKVIPDFIGGTGCHAGGECHEHEH